jgi:hypothetical protein
MGLAQPRSAEDEQRVVDRGGLVRDRQTGRVGEAVAASDDESLERETGIQLTVEPRARVTVRGSGRRRSRTGLDRRDGSCGGRRRLVRMETNRRSLAQHFRHRLAERGQVVFVDPVHEEGVGNLEIDVLGAELARHDRLEPRVECLVAAEPRPDRIEDLLPESMRFLRLESQAGHFNESLLKRGGTIHKDGGWGTACPNVASPRVGTPVWSEISNLSTWGQDDGTHTEQGGCLVWRLLSSTASPHSSGGGWRRCPKTTCRQR